MKDVMRCLILSLFVASAQAIGSSEETCAQLVKKVEFVNVQSAEQFRKGIRDYFFADQNEGPFLSRGLYVELASGKKVFSVSDYLGSEHALMLSDIERSNPGDKLEKILWSGELEFEKSSSGEFQIKQANHTSGMWFQAKQGEKPLPLSEQPKELLNDFLLVKGDLESKGIAFAPDFKSVLYSDEEKHLLNMGVSKDNSLLHAYSNKANYLGYAVATLTPQTSLGDIKEVAEDFSSPISTQMKPVLLQMKKIYGNRADEEFKKDLDLYLEFAEDLLLIHESASKANLSALDQQNLDQALSRIRAPGFFSAMNKAIVTVSKAVQSYPAPRILTLQ